MTEMSKINSLQVKKYSLYIICSLNQEQMSPCWSEHLLDITNENNYKLNRNRSYFIV